jgi:type IV pilus assembly protein PilN
VIKINLVREGRAIRGAGAVPVTTAATTGGVGAGSANNLLIVAGVLFGVLVGLGYWLWQKRELGHRQETVTLRSAEAQKLEAVIREVEEYQKQRDRLQQRIDLINQLKENQKGPVRIMDQISRDLPDLVWLDTMEITAGRINMSGRGLNPNAIALFIENIKNDSYFEEPQVGSVTQVSATPPVYTFDMQFAFTYAPKADSAEATAAQGEPAAAQ